MVPIVTVKNDVSQSVNGYDTSGGWGGLTLRCSAATLEKTTLRKLDGETQWGSGE